MNWPFIQSLLAWTSAAVFCFLSYRSLVALNCGMNPLLLHNHLQENMGKLLTCSNFAHFMDGRVKSSVLIICEHGHYFIAPQYVTDQVSSSAVKALIVGEDVLLKPALQ
jgi:hypothetical protein